MVCGVGIDLVDINRIERVTEKWGEAFLNRVYRAGEIEYCTGHAHPARHFAARFAAKEAFLKSLGIGLFEGVKLKDVEVVVLESGRPELSLHGRALEMATGRGIASFHLSLSHSNRLATALVILET